MVNEAHAARANENNYNAGFDYSLADALSDEEFLETPEGDEEKAERQRVNEFMFGYFYG